MLEYYLKLLDSFKERQTSKLLRSIRQQILAKIQSPYFNPAIQTYFKKPINLVNLLPISQASRSKLLKLKRLSMGSTMPNWHFAIWKRLI